MENRPPLKTLLLEEHLAWIRRRKVELGLPEIDTKERTESLRNKGRNRTPEKRAALRLVEERCRAAGIEPIKSYY